MRNDQPAVRRGLQPRAAERRGRHDGGPRPAGHPAAVLCHRGPAVRRGQRERGAVEPGLRGREHQVAAAGPGRDDHRRRAGDPAVRRQPAAGPLLLRVDLFRQRGQHAGRPQRLLVAQGAGRGAGPAGDGADRRRHDRRAGARHQQGRGRRDGVSLEDSVARGADPQPLHRPDVHRGQRAAASARPKPSTRRCAKCWKASGCSWSRTRSSARPR